MNIKRVAMMLTIMLITILSASSFYILTGEAELNQIITVNSKQDDDGTWKGQDYEKVYVSNDEDAPYTETSGKYTGKKYYIRYTGAKSHKTVIDLYNADQTDEDGKPLGGYDVTKEDDGTIKIFNQSITSTYKMFSYREESGKKYNTEITRVFVPSTIAFPKKNSNGVPIQEGSDEGIASNTFEGWTADKEKDVIYHTDNVLTNNETRDARGEGITDTYKRTEKISKNTYPNITTYVYLGNENVVREDEGECSTNDSYSGQVKNVFVSNEIYNVSNMFYHGSGTPIDRVLLDTRDEWNGYKSFIGMFYNQTSLQLTDNFQIPEGVQVLKNMFNRCTSITSLPTQLTLPKSTTNVEGILYGCTGLTSIPNSFQIPDKVTSTYQMFYGCTSLASIPDNYKIPNKTTTMQEMFSGCTKLKGSVLIADEVTKSFNITNAFYNAGTFASNYKECNTPLIVRYPVANATIDNYTTNVYTPQTTSGKVTMIPITNNNDTTQWEKIYEGGAPNYDEGGAYYIRYKGTDTTVTTVYMDSIERDDKGAGNKNFDIKFSAGTKNPCVLDTKLRSTYKMFSKRNENDTEIERVFLPSTLAIKGDQSTSGNIYNNNGIASNTFEGWNTNTEKDVIYHTGKLSDTDRNRGYGIRNYNRTTKINKTTYPNVAIYVYLGTENFSRKKENPFEPPSNGTNNNYQYYQYAYIGEVPNVYVSKEITYVVSLFSRYGIRSTTWTANTGSIVNKVLLDENGEWDSFADLFAYQLQLDLPEKFSINNKKEITNIEELFYITNITHVPHSFSIPTSVTRYSALFLGCYYLSGTIDMPCKLPLKYSTECETIMGKTYGGINYYAGANATTKDPKYGTPIVIRCYKGSRIDVSIANTSYVHKIYYEDETSSQSSANNTIVNVQQATNKIVIEDCTEEISVKVNEVSSQKLSVEDETDYVSVTVNKNVEENKSEEDEVQE